MSLVPHDQRESQRDSEGKRECRLNATPTSAHIISFPFLISPGRNQESSVTFSQLPISEVETGDTRLLVRTKVLREGSGRDDMETNRILDNHRHSRLPTKVNKLDCGRFHNLRRPVVLCD